MLVSDYGEIIAVDIYTLTVELFSTFTPVPSLHLLQMHFDVNETRRSVKGNCTKIGGPGAQGLTFGLADVTRSEVSRRAWCTVSNVKG